MPQTTLPKFNMDKSETGCCPRFDPAGWDGAQLEFDERLFVRATTVNFLHFPLNIGSVITRTLKRIEQADAAPHDEFLMLATDPSPWRGELFFAVAKDVPDAEMVRLSGRFLTKVYEGSYSEAGKWARDMEQHITSQGLRLWKLYFFYTTCPSCDKFYGKNYTVVLAMV